MLSATFDTNLYISVLNFGGIPLQLVNMGRRGVIRVDASDAIFEELADVLHTKFGWQESDIVDAISQIKAFANHVTSTETLSAVSRDPDDDAILECATAARSAYLVTGDKDLLQLGSHGATRIIKPAEFLVQAKSRW